MSELTRSIHKNFVLVDKVALIGFNLPSSTIRNDVLILCLNALDELEKNDANSEIIIKLKKELEDFA